MSKKEFWHHSSRNIVVDTWYWVALGETEQKYYQAVKDFLETYRRKDFFVPYHSVYELLDEGHIQTVSHLKELKRLFSELKIHYIPKIETISHEGFLKKTDTFWGSYRHRPSKQDKRPNPNLSDIATRFLLPQFKERGSFTFITGNSKDFSDMETQKNTQFLMIDFLLERRISIDPEKSKLGNYQGSCFSPK